MTAKAALWYALVMKLAVFGLVCCFPAYCSILDPLAIDTSLFSVTTFASGLGFPANMLVSGGDLLADTSTNYGYATGQVLSIPLAGGSPTSVYNTTVNGFTTGLTQVGNYYVVGNDGSLYGATGNHSFTFLQPGSTTSSPMSAVASLNLVYASGWEHDNIGIAAEPTPGVPGSYDFIVNIGAYGDNTATPSTDTVALSGTGFATAPSAVLNGDSLYDIRIDETGTAPVVTSVTQVATGIRNVFGLQFDSSGNLYFTDNGQDGPEEPDGQPPQADEIDYMSAATLAATIGGATPPNYGFPSCYTQYAGSPGFSGVPVGNDCIQPLAAFQPISYPGGTTWYEQGATTLALAPASFPAGFNNGLFVGFTGETLDEAGLLYYDFGTGLYTQIIQGGDLGGNQTGNIIGVAASGNALFVSDVHTGEIYEITDATPEPGSWVLVLSTLLAGGWLLAKRRRGCAFYR